MASSLLKMRKPARNPSTPRGSSFRLDTDDARRKRIRLFSSANEDLLKTNNPVRHIRCLRDLTDLELLALRNIVVQCAISLGDTESPGPDVVDGLLGFIFKDGWTSNGRLGSLPKLAFREQRSIMKLHGLELWEAANSGYIDFVGQLNSGTQEVYGRATIIGNESTPDGIQLRYEYYHDEPITFYRRQVAAQDIRWAIDKADPEGRMADLSLCHDQLMIDQFRMNNLKAAVTYGRKLVFGFATGNSVNLQETHDFPSLDASEPNDIKKHLISSMFPSILVKSSRKLKKGLEKDVLDSLDAKFLVLRRLLP